MAVRILRCAAAMIFLVVPAVTSGQSGPTQRELDDAGFSAGNWLHPNHDYAGTRFVDVKQINRQSVSSLSPVCMFQSDERVPSETNPLEYNGILYITTTHYTVALDASDCRVRWKYFGRHGTRNRS
ncbi:MAG: hypothetical protein WCD40_02920 [Candidatus Acidiferrales bacterium]